MFVPCPFILDQAGRTALAAGAHHGQLRSAATGMELPVYVDNVTDVFGDTFALRDTVTVSQG